MGGLLRHPLFFFGGARGADGSSAIQIIMHYSLNIMNYNFVSLWY